MKKLLKSLMLMSLVAIMLTSCDQKTKKLKEQVDKFNKACPLPFGDIMTLNSVILDDNTVEMKVIANEGFASISALNSHKDDVIEILSMSLSKETSKALVDKIIDAGANLKTTIVGGQSGSRAEFELTANDLKVAKEKFANMTEGQKLIASNVLGMKIKLPVVIDDITKLVGLSLTSDALIYKYEVNDSETGKDIDSATSFMKYITLSQMANSVKGGMVGERNRQFYQALIDHNQGIECEYHELQFGKKTSFRISTEEIKEVLNGKWDSQLSAKDWENLGNALENFANTYDTDSIEEIVEPVDSVIDYSMYD